jgi:hypothetical protein
MFLSFNAIHSYFFHFIFIYHLFNPCDFDFLYSIHLVFHHNFNQNFLIFKTIQLIINLNSIRFLSIHLFILIFISIIIQVTKFFAFN